MYVLPMIVVGLLLSVAVAGQELTPAQFEEYKATHPQEFSGKLEGDILIEPGFRNGMSNPRRRWPGGAVYFDVTNMDVIAKSLIRSSVKKLEKRIGSDCMKFKERTNEGNYIKIISGKGCYSHIGMIGGAQEMSLGAMCFLGSSAIHHEFLHAVGFHHEQSRSDRDKYITVNWDNISEKQKHNFRLENTNNLDTPYNFGSIMHYDRFAFSKNLKTTMTAKKGKGSVPIFGNTSVDQMDVDRVRKMYGCTTQCSNKQSAFNCWFWKVRGNCGNKLKFFMEKYCRKTCKFC